MILEVKYLVALWKVGDFSEGGRPSALFVGETDPGRRNIVDVVWDESMREDLDPEKALQEIKSGLAKKYRMRQDETFEPRHDVSKLTTDAQAIYAKEIPPNNIIFQEVRRPWTMVD
jgi:hypothetical protein